VYDAGLAGGLKAVIYTVLAGDTLSSIATGLAAALTADTSLQGIGISATSAGQVVTLQSNSINATTLRETTSAAATEQISLNVPANGVQTAVVGGTKTTGNILTITTYDAGLPGGSQAISYTVLAGDTLATMTAGLATAINANANLTAAGVTATSFSTVLNLRSTSINNTTYTKTLSGGATATITLAPSSSVSQYTYNNLNELTAIAAGGATKFEATTNKALKSATVNSNPATLNWSKNFAGNATLANGANTVPVGATDGANTTVANNYQVGVTGPSNSSLTFDANGNMTSDGTNSYAWDAENRLIKITYPGSGNFSQILYEASEIIGQITETAASTLTSTKQFVNDGVQLCEERDATNLTVKKYYSRGQANGGSSFSYAFDHLGSVREMTDSSTSIQARYEYGLYGQGIRTIGAIDSDFQYASYYVHAPSALNLTVFRPYNSRIGRWITRDPAEEMEGSNLYAYLENDPLIYTDSLGLGKGQGKGKAIAKTIICLALLGLCVGGNQTMCQLMDSFCDLKCSVKGRTGKQAKLKQLAGDDKLGSRDRGFLKQDLNQIDRGKRETLRVPPGKQLAHDRGREAQKGYGYEHSKLQDTDLHNLQHKHDNNGKLNKERPVE